MNVEIVNPVVGNFVKSLRDIGYTFEVAVADVLDNSITALSENIKILCLPYPQVIFAILDDGLGMNEAELVNAMRLSTNDPDIIRESNDLGKFGLGLKTASFSQCKKMTVISKKDNRISLKKWDLEYISKMNEWLLITPEIEDYKELPLINSLLNQDHGTLVIWENIDSFNMEDIPHKLLDLRSHLSMVFHYFLEGKVPERSKLEIVVNEEKIVAFNPFNPNHRATQELQPEKIQFKGSEILVQPYILPHHSKLSQPEFERYATTEGYTKSQGFYLYREHRLLIHGTWWGMHKISDSHRLVRIKVNIQNTHDAEWGIDIKKSTARPVRELKKDLQRIIQQVTVKGSRPFVGRGRKIEDSNTTNFWDRIVKEGVVRFVINKEHPLYKKLNYSLSEHQQDLFKIYSSSLEGYLPLDTIVAQLHTNPHKLNQEPEISNEELVALVKQWRATGVSEEFISSLMKTEIFRDKKEILLDEKQ